MNIKELNNLLKNNQSFLNLSHQQLNDECATMIAQHLEKNDCKTVYLNLSNNCILSGGAQHISTAISTPKCPLKSLNLNNNFIGPQGAIALAQALIHSKLKSLKLENNFIGPSGAIAFMSAFKNQECSLKYLYLKFNHIGPHIFHSILIALQSTPINTFIQF
ncbi:MAG TPA: hypothetical protein QF353_05835 [Gammaproteobacteria bacterium]|nr:hypothetical protein [Gammaproteobacteria bacterium]